MTVKELIEQLKAYNPNAEVILAQDPEGNGFWGAYEVALPDEHTDEAVVIWPDGRFYEDLFN